MAIVARILEEVGAVAVTPLKALTAPNPAAVFAIIGSPGSQGSKFIDDEVLGVRVFTFPKEGFRIVFEPNRVRVEALAPKKPEDLHLAERLTTVCEMMYPGAPFFRFGFNYDTTYQYDTVIPQRDIMSAFIKPEGIEDMTHFGFQCSFLAEKGKRRDTYFLKATSPLELRVLANIEFDRPLPKSGDAQSLYERCYTESRSIVDRLTF